MTLKLDAEPTYCEIIEACVNRFGTKYSIASFEERVDMEHAVEQDIIRSREQRMEDFA